MRFRNIKIFFISVILIFVTTAYADDISFSVIGNKYGLSSSFDNTKIIQVTKQALKQKNINYTEQGPYLSIKIQPIYPANKNRSLIVYLLSKMSFCLKIIKLTVDSNYAITSIQENYQLTQVDLEQQPLIKEQISCPDSSVQFVVGTQQVPEFKNVQTAVTEEYLLAQKHGYKSIQLLNKSVTIQNYANWLSCKNLKGFSHIGHGSNAGILLEDGFLDYRYFKQATSTHKNTVITFNSCSVFSGWWYRDAIFNYYKPQKFSSGISDLLIFGGTETYQCFWEQAFQGKSLSGSLESCRLANDPATPGNHAGLYIANFTRRPLEIITNKQQISLPGKPLDKVVLHLLNNEFVQSIYIPEPYNQTCTEVDHTPGLKSAEMLVHLDENSGCFVETWNEKNMPDIFGFGGEGDDYLTLPDNK